MADGAPNRSAVPTLADFVGTWTLLRRIDDRRSGQSGRFDGSATFTLDDAGLTYDEAGTLTLGAAAPMNATRRYFWRADGPRIAVLFADGRPFHSFAADVTQADHWCDPDSYRVAYDFARWPDWTATWDVTGPRKDYRLTSRYHAASSTR